MKLGIKKISNIDAYWMRNTFHEIQRICEKYGLEAELQFYDVCDGNSTTEISESGEYVDQVLRID